MIYSTHNYGMNLTNRHVEVDRDESKCNKGWEVGHEAGKAAWPDDDCIRSMCVADETWGRAAGALTCAMMSNALTPIKPDNIWRYGQYGP